MPQQILEQLEFANGQVERAIAACGAAGHQIDLEVRGLQSKHLGRSAAPQQGANARQQLGQREGLDEVIVSAQIETTHAVVDPIASRENQDRRLDVPLPERLEDLQSAASRQHQVEHDEIEGLGVRTEEPVLTG